MESQAAGNDGRGGGRAGRLLWVLAAAVTVALVAGTLAGALRDPVPLPEGTPEETVQRYIEAVRERDYLAAVATFSDELARACRATDFRLDGMREPVTVTLDGVQVRDGRAVVTVRLRSAGGEPPLPIFETAYPQDFVLVEDEDGTWVIDEEPWPLYYCERPR